MVMKGQITKHEYKFTHQTEKHNHYKCIHCPASKMKEKAAGNFTTHFYNGIRQYPAPKCITRKIQADGTPQVEQ